METRDVLNKLIYPKLTAQLVFSDLHDLKTNSKGIIATCPKCGKKDEFFCYQDGHYGKCTRGCGWKVSWWEHIANRFGLGANRRAILQKLAEMAGVELPPLQTNISPLKSIKTVEEARELIIATGKRFASEMPPEFVKYMAGRGFDRELIKRAGILYMERERMRKALFCAGISKELLNGSGITGAKFGEEYRILLPHYNEEGKCIGFIGRLSPGLEPIDGKLPKYKNSTGETGMTLDVPFLFHEANQAGCHKMILVRGPFDALLINHKDGMAIKGGRAVALLRNSLNDNALTLINNTLPPIVILALGSDEAGQTGTIELIRKIRKRMFVVSDYYGHKDPGELIASGHDGVVKFKETLSKAAPVPVWLFRHLMPMIRSAGAGGRLDILAMAAPVYNNLISDEDKEIFLNEARSATLLHKGDIAAVVGL